jgi:hypothetical protein
MIRLPTANHSHSIEMMRIYRRCMGLRFGNSLNLLLLFANFSKLLKLFWIKNMKALRPYMIYIALVAEYMFWIYFRKRKLSLLTKSEPHLA